MALSLLLAGFGKPFRAGESGASSGAAAWTLTMVTGGALLLLTLAGCYLLLGDLNIS